MKKINLVWGLLFGFSLSLVCSFSIGFDHGEFEINNYNIIGNNVYMNITNDFGEYKFNIWIISDYTNDYKYFDYVYYFNTVNNSINFSFDKYGLANENYYLLFEAYYNENKVDSQKLFDLGIINSEFYIKSVNFNSLYSLEELGHYREIIFDIEIIGDAEFEIKYELINEFGESIGNYSEEFGEKIIINGTDIYESEKDGRYYLRNIELYENDKFVVGYFNSSLSEDASYLEFYNWNLSPIVIEKDSNIIVKSSSGGSGSSSGSSSTDLNEKVVEIENITVNEKEIEVEEIGSKEDIEIEETNEIIENVGEKEDIKIDLSENAEEIVENTQIDMKVLGTAAIGIFAVIGIMLLIPK